MAPFFKKKSKHSKSSSTDSTSTNGASPRQNVSREPSGGSAKLHSPLQQNQQSQFRSPSATVSTPDTRNASSGSAMSTPLRQLSGNGASRQVTPQRQQRTPSNSSSVPVPVPAAAAAAADQGSRKTSQSDETSPQRVRTAPPPPPLPANQSVIPQPQLRRPTVATPWKKKTLYNSPFPRFSHAASSTTSETGAIYLMGGLCGKNVFGDMWIIEPVKIENDSVSEYPYIASPIENFERVPTPRIGHSSVLIGNAFIVFAGDTVTSSTQVLDNKLYFFNITSLKWTITSPEGPKPDGRYGHQIAVLNFETLEEPTRWLSYLYVFGGQLEDEFLGDIWRFDLSNFRSPQTHWVKIETQISQFRPPALANHTMTAYNDKLFVYGGTDGVRLYDSLLCFDASTETWTECKLHGTFKPPPLEDHSAALYQNLLFIYGGKTLKGETSGDLFIIDLNNFNCFKIISNLPNYPQPRCGHSLTVDTLNEKLIIMGGDQNDRDFANVSETANSLIQDSQFEYPSSVIYEFDLTALTKFMEVATFNKNQPKKLEQSSVPLAKEPQVGGQEFVDANETLSNISETAHLKHAPSRASQYGVYEEVSDDTDDESHADEVALDTSIQPEEDSFTVSTPLADETIISEEKEVPSLANEENTDSLSVGELADDEKFRNPMIETPMTAEFDNELKTPQGTPQGTPHVDRSVEDYTPNSKPTHPLRIISVGDSKPNQLASPMIPVNGKHTEVEPRQTERSLVSPSASPEVGKLSSENPLSKPTPQSALPVTPALSGNPVTPANGSLPRTPGTHDEEKIQSMAKMLQQIKLEMREKITEANERITQLEAEKLELSNKLKDMESKPTQKDASESSENGNSLDRGIEAESEATSGTEAENELAPRSRIQFQNKLLQLDSQNQTLTKKIEHYETLSKEWASQLEGLNSLIKSQQTTVEALESKLIGEAALQKQLHEWEAKYKSLEVEFNNLKCFHGLDGEEREIGLSSDDEVAPKQAVSLSFRQNVADLTSIVDALVNVLNGKSSLKSGDRSIESNGSATDGAISVDHKDELIEKLQAQVDELLQIKETERDTFDSLNSQLNQSSLKLKEVEDSYKKSLASLNNTHRALTLSQKELEKQKEANKILSVEMEELKLKKRNFSSSNNSPSEAPEDASNVEEEEDHELDTRYGFKIRDLEADLFIVSQERDQLRDEIVALKKTLFNSKQSR